VALILRCETAGKMSSGSDFLVAPTSDHETWRASVHSLGYGSFESDGFKGSMRGSRMWGITAREVAFASHTASKFERTHQDVRLDGMDYYRAMFQISGRETLLQNDRVLELAVGDCALLDMTRPGSVITDSCRNLSLWLPRRSLISHLGLEPSGGMCWHGATTASRLLFRLVLDALSEGDPSSAEAEPYMQLAIYDLFGALFAGSDLPPNSSYNDKLFTRVCNIAKNHFSDPEITIGDVASEAGISVRYLQKLFTARGTTCSRFIQSLRFDHAARLLSRRKNDQIRPATYRDRLCLRVPRLRAFFSTIPPSLWVHAKCGL
jgi:AraC family transcriptional regulator, positive regulator of tynA and feaB